MSTLVSYFVRVDISPRYVYDRGPDYTFSGSMYSKEWPNLAKASVDEVAPT